MAGYNHYSQYQGYNPYYNLPPNFQSPISPNGYPLNQHLLQSVSSDSLHAAYINYEDGTQPILPAQAGQMRIRRRPTAGSDAVKHRRTRSGCYTCRSRRVRCDETHPTCDRCRKGNRECLYPEPAQSSKAGGKGKPKSSPSDHHSSDDGELDDNDDNKGHLETIPDDDEDESEEPQSAIQDTFSPNSHTQSNDDSTPPSLTADKSPSPLAEVTKPLTSRRPTMSRRQSRQALRSGFPQKAADSDLPALEYLDYYEKNITCHHYALKFDPDELITGTVVKLARTHPPLLYATAGFAAYHQTLTKPNGRVNDFLGFYTNAVKLLRLSIVEKRHQSIATLLTILQLASIEEVLGDWINLKGHIRAANELLTNLYNPKDVQLSGTLRKALQWYVRFELFIAIQSGYEDLLPREWYLANHDYYANAAQKNPNDVSVLYEERFAYTRLLAHEIAILFARKVKNAVSDEIFGATIISLQEKFDKWPSELSPLLTDPAFYVNDFSDALPRDEGDIVDPYAQNTFFGGDRWVTNFVMIDFWAVELMFQSYLVGFKMRMPGEDMTRTALKTAQIFEAIELYPKALPGSLIDAQASFALGTLFLPRDKETQTWCRQKFAAVEKAGYVYPDTLRTRMAETWDTEIGMWWLPEEHCPRIIRELHDFIKERSTAAKDQSGEDLKALRGIFENMSLNRSRRKGISSSSDGASPTFSMGSEGSAEPLTEHSPPLKWDYGHDDGGLA